MAWGRWGATMNETMGTADMNALRSKAPPLPKCGGGHRQDNGSRTEGAARGGGGQARAVLDYQGVGLLDKRINRAVTRGGPGVRQRAYCMMRGGAGRATGYCGAGRAYRRSILRLLRPSAAEERAGQRTAGAG